MLKAFADSEIWLWVPAGSGTLDHRQLIAWMKAPKPGQLQRYYRYWGIPDVFSAITRSPHTRSYYYLKVDEIVTKRNNIAHGDLTTEATQADVRIYKEVVSVFCQRADRMLSMQLGRLLSSGRPW
jgi:hypothetical protein